MHCCEFRERYSDYTDGLLTIGESSDARMHLAACEACRRFDAAFRAGVDTLRALPGVGVSRGFGPRLRAKLRRELAVRVPVVAHWSGAMGTLLLVAAVGVVGWDLISSRAARHDRLPVGRSALTLRSTSAALPAPGPHAAAPRFDSIAISFDAFHPLQSILAATTTQVTAVGEDRPHYDLSVVWGGP